MKRATILFVMLLTAAFTITAQPPQAFKYKAIARDKYGRLLVNQQVAMRISILQGSETGIAVYVETHTPYSNTFGIIDLDIGRGTPELGTMAAIDWGASDYFIKIEMDPKCKPKKEYTVIGTSQLLSVPYALYAGHVQNSEDNDADPLNELITSSYLSGTTLTLQEGLNTILIDLSGLLEGIEDDDADPENEIQDLQLVDNKLIITKNGTAAEIDLGVFLDNTDNQQLTLTGQELAIQNGNTVILPDKVNDADADPTNEIQVLSLAGNMLTLTTNGTPIQIDLAPYLDNTDHQTLLLDDHQLTLTNGNTIRLPDNVNDADHDPYNELQFLSMRNDTVYLSKGGYVVLPAASQVNGYFCYGDKDQDGFGDQYKALWVPANIPAPLGYLTNSTDCNDNNQLIKPGRIENCDGLDNDCDGIIDEDCVSPGCNESLVAFLNCLESNECQLGEAECMNSNCFIELVQVLACINEACFYALIANPEVLPFDESWTTEAKADYIIQHCESPDADGDGYATYEGDCNDSDSGIHPGAADICGDGIDQNCNGQDAVCGDQDGDGYTTQAGDCDDMNPGIYPGANDGCDGIDNNCNGTLDEDGMQPYFRDADEDGYGDPGNFEMFCDDIQQGYVDNNDDCNDNDPAIHPGAAEVCEDGIDQDCNGSDLPCTALTDNDGDGYSEVQGDCNDSDPTIHPGAAEICDDGIDQNCDGTIDDGCCHALLVQLFRCMDENGCMLGDQSCIANNCSDRFNALTECMDNECVLNLFNNPELLPFDDSWSNDARADYVLSVCGSTDIDGDGYSPAEGDCNDMDPLIHPGASEICGDGIDQNCNGSDAACDDADEDGYTVAEGDCDNHDPKVFPGAVEACDGKDNDCDGTVDEGTPGSTWFRDADGDGFGNPEIYEESCAAPAGYVDNDLDCNDGSSAVYPEAPEICGDGIDQDCNGEDLLCPEDIDDDGDEYSENQGDCDDTDAFIHPGATEKCGDDIDQDCNGGDLVCDPNIGWQPGEPWIDPQDGHPYQTITIGTQVWMAENLQAAKYNDGTSIPLVTDNNTWTSLTTPGYCYYNNDQSTYGNTYGPLYNYYTVNMGNLCPSGWHVPNTDEWLMMAGVFGGIETAGGKLKEMGTAHWIEPNTGATNEIGYNALPGGYRFFENGNFFDVGIYGIWWSSAEFDANHSVYIHMHYNDVKLNFSHADPKSNGFSVRCIKD